MLSILQFIETGALRITFFIRKSAVGVEKTPLQRTVQPRYHAGPPLPYPENEPPSSGRPRSNVPDANAGGARAIAAGLAGGHGGILT